MNRLADAASTYLRQHAGQPVEWWPWGLEAFAEARRRDVPVLVSIGYATCHWCHVMAHESFDDPETARLMNELLVCIKVDREEHPEVDAIYMDAVQALSGHGGWPLNAFTDHEGRPFHALTYLPRPHWQRLVREVARVWRQDRTRLAALAAELTAHLRAEDAGLAGAWDPAVRRRFRDQIAAVYDAEHPGLAWNPERAPKFPPSTQLLLLLSGDAEERRIAASILTAMQDSGLHERVGGGFHRYSVDRAWRVPHFEKMLYDNAQLMAAYARAHLAFGREDFLATAVNAADYLLRELRVYEGGRFVGYAAGEDADDAGGEGSFYAWTPEALREALGAEAGERLAREWDIRPGEPLRGPSGHAEPVASHIPHPRGSGLDPGPRRAAWEQALPILRAVRAARPRPARDELTPTDWNGLALEGLAWVARASGEARHLAAVRELAAALLARRTAHGLERLPGRPALATDYGALAAGLLAAFDALGDPALVDAAAALWHEAMERLGADDGGFYTAPAGRADLLRRSREHLDNAWPSGEAQLAWTAARLWLITGDDGWRARAERTLRAAAAVVNRAPASAATALRAARLLEQGGTLVLSGEALLATARRCPDDALAIVPLAACAERPWATLEGRRGLEQPQALLCRAGACLPPARDAETLQRWWSAL